MQKLNGKPLLLLGFTLFSMFFGAGNLIFPPFLGAQAGTNLWLAFAGFAVSAIGLPIAGVISVARADGLPELAGRVHPAFARIFAILLYLSIGPLLGITDPKEIAQGTIRAGGVAAGLLTLSLPLLHALYPAAIALIFLSFLPRNAQKPSVYRCCILPTALQSIAAAFPLGVLSAAANALPLASLGFGWVVPAGIGICVGLVIDR